MTRFETFRFRTAREARPVRIVGDAAVATGSLSEGRLVPVLIVDASDRPDIKELVRVHQDLNPGDVSLWWGQRKKQEGSVILIVQFERPIELTMVIEFDIESQGSLVDLILRSRAFFLQTGQEGDRFIITQNRPRIIVDVPDMGFEPVWEKLLVKRLTRSFRKEGHSRSNARKAALQFLKEWRRFSSMRMPI